MLRFLAGSAAIEEPEDEVDQIYGAVADQLSHSRDSLEAACDRADEIQKRHSDPPIESGTAE